MVYVNVLGRLGADAEVHQSEKGKFVTFRMATNDFIDGQQTTIWLSVSCPSESVIKLAPYLTKGRMVQIYGRERVRLYTDRNGATQISRDVFATNVDMVATGNSGSTQSESVVREATTTNTTQPTSTREQVTSAIDDETASRLMACGTMTQPQVAMAASSDVDDLPF